MPHLTSRPTYNNLRSINVPKSNLQLRKVSQMISVIPVVFDQIGAKVDIDGHKWMSRHHIGRYEPSGMHVTFLLIWIWLQCERVGVWACHALSGLKRG